MSEILRGRILDLRTDVAYLKSQLKRAVEYSGELEEAANKNKKRVAELEKEVETLVDSIYQHNCKAIGAPAPPKEQDDD